MNKFMYLLCIIMLIGELPNTASAQPALMPMPAKVQMLAGKTQLNAELGVYISKQQQALLTPLVLNSTFAQQFTRLDWRDVKNAQLQISISQSAAPLPYLGMDESYEIVIADNTVKLTSNNQYGMLRGLASLSQLLFSAEQPRELTNLTITDAPTYPWRGLLFDSVRHFLPIADLKRTLRGLASAKFNVFHWHLTDDQGWRIELTSYPKLHQQASDSLYYTQAEIKEVVSYAAKLGIRVVPEFDVPGHASSIVLAYPELGSGTTRTEIERRWGVFEPLLDPSNPKVYQFIDEVVAELAGLFPDPYLHIGGDEVDDSDWKKNTKIQAFMAAKKLANSHALHAYFNQRIAKILAKHNKQMIGWDEVLHSSLPKNTLVQSWRGHHSLSDITSAGHDGLLSSGFYIDQPQWTSYHYRNHPIVPTQAIVAAKNIVGKVEFTLTRLKGSAVVGDVTIFSNQQGKLHGKVSITGKGSFITANVNRVADHYQLQIDTWMGPTKLIISVDKASNEVAMIGNTPYEFTAAVIDNPSVKQLNKALTEQQHRKKIANVLGGEATAWAELITSDNLDTRIWPRLYAIAERFWSPASLTDERDMYKRLAVMDNFADQQLGLLHQQQFIKRLKQQLAVTSTDLNALLTFTQLIEPVHYYTLHHLAFLRGDYHQQAPLNKLVDVLPVESLALKKFDYSVADYQQQCGSQQLSALQNQLLRWQQVLTDNRQLFLTINEWQVSYLVIMTALKNKDKLNKTQAIEINNGVIAQVINSINLLKQARLICSH